MNDALANALLCLVALVGGYLFGSIPSGVIIGRVFFHKDPRDFGSGNSGGTNTGRVLGKKAGFATIALDMFKVLIPFYCFWAYLAFSGVLSTYDIFDNGVLYLWLLPVAATLGHCFPVYLGFRGGKAVACYYGILGGTSYVSAGVALVAFLSLLKAKKMVSFTSLISSFICLVFVYVMATLDWVIPGFDTSILFWNFGVGGLLYYGFEMAGALTIIYVILVIRHAGNIKRLKAGTESKITWLK